MTIPWAMALPAPSSRPPVLRLVPPVCDSADQPPLPYDDVEARAEPGDGLSPPVERAVRAIVRAACETLAGHRPPAQVRPVLAPRVGLLLDHLLRAGVGRGLRVGSVRVQAARPDVVEVAVRVVTPRGEGALALCVERDGGRWLVTALEAGLGPDVRRPARA